LPFSTQWRLNAGLSILLCTAPQLLKKGSKYSRVKGVKFASEFAIIKSFQKAGLAWGSSVIVPWLISLWPCLSDTPSKFVWQASLAQFAQPWRDVSTIPYLLQSVERKKVFSVVIS